MPLDRICCIIDIDGFSIRVSNDGNTYADKFLFRELGYIQVEPYGRIFQPQSCRFDLRGYDFNGCLKESWRTVNYQIKHVVGLPLFPAPGEEVVDHEDRFALVRSIYERCRQPHLELVGFKGGICEKNVLEELNIPSVNLETYGCPNYQKIMKSHPATDCGFHISAAPNVKQIHCPLVEVAAFRDWLIQVLQPSRDTSASPCGLCAEPSSASFCAHSFSDPCASSDSE